jgi:hypothetical protein
MNDEVIFIDDEEMELDEILFPPLDEEEYLQTIKNYIEYMRSIDEKFNKHCKELEELEDEE